MSEKKTVASVQEERSALIVSPSPHVGFPLTTRKVMLAVVVALVPSLIASVVFYGAYPLLVVCLSVGAAVLAEWIYNKIRKQKTTVSDCSAIVTGMILGLNLPPVLPIYIPIIGSFFSIIVVKMLFGGLGKNFANPAACGRVFLLLAFSSDMTKWVAPVDWAAGAGKGLFGYFGEMFGGTLDAVTSATPLVKIASDGVGNVDLLDLFLGRIGGSAGETCAIAILIGGIFLILTKIIDWKIPLAVIVSTVLSTLVFYQDPSYILPMLLSGGLLFGAFFMATDYSTSPNTFWGKLIFAVGIGFFTILIRKFGGYPEGVSFSILFMNLFVPLLDKIIVPKPFGAKRSKKKKSEKEGGK